MDRMMTHPIPDAVLIAGPTASGKSSLALEIARKIDGVIVNADSMQIYEGLQILSARPDEADMGGIEHQLYGYVDPSLRYSVGKWLDDAVCAIKAIRAKGRCPILVGGTGLYFKALLEGLNDMPDVPDAIRSFWKAEQQRGVGTQALHAHLQERDPAMAAQLKAGDTQRILRALEIFDATGKSLLYWQEQSALRQDIGIAKDAWQCVLCPPRALVYQKIEDRFDQMVALGGIEEANGMVARGLDPVLPAMKAIGVEHLSAASQGQLDLEEAIALCKRDTRRYAKRQMTWIRNQMGDWPLFETAKGALAYFDGQMQQIRRGN